MSPARWAAAAIVIVTLGMNAGTLWVMVGTDFLSRYVGPGITDLDIAILYVALVGLGAVTTSYVSVGMLLSGRPGAGRIAAVLLAGGALFAATPFGYSVGAELVFAAPQNELANALFLVGPVSVGPAVSLILPGLALLFPTGRLPSRRWRLPVALIAVAIGGGTVVSLIRPGPIAANTGSHNPFGIDGLPAGLNGVADTLISAAVVGFVILGVAAVLTRHRHGDVTLRQQLRWFVAAVLLAAVPLPMSVVPAVGGPQWAALACIGLLLVPVSVGIAVTRHRLYEIDRVISRGVSWAVLTGLLVAVYAAGVLILQSLLSGVTQGETLAVAASTLLAAALFQPLRGRVQRAMDRRFDRARYDAERTTAAFAERLRDVIDLKTLSAEVRRVAGETVRPTSVAVWLRTVADSQKSPVS